MEAIRDGSFCENIANINITSDIINENHVNINQSRGSMTAIIKVTMMIMIATHRVSSFRRREKTLPSLRIAVQKRCSIVFIKYTVL